MCLIVLGIKLMLLMCLLLLKILLKLVFIFIVYLIGRCMLLVCRILVGIFVVCWK